jgi:hypothetical protein
MRVGWPLSNVTGVLIRRRDTGAETHRDATMEAETE